LPDPGAGARPPWDAEDRYLAADVQVYARLRSAEAFATSDEYAAYRAARDAASSADVEDSAEDKWLAVPAAASFGDVLRHPHHVLGGPLVLELRPSGTAEHIAWRTRSKVFELELNK